MAKGTMTLRELIDSSARVESKYGVHSYGRETINTKEFGEVHYNDKVVYYNKKYNVLEIRVLFGITPNTIYGANLYIAKITFLDIDPDKVDPFNSFEELKATLLEESKRNTKKRKENIDKLGQRQANLDDEVTLEKYFDGSIILPCANPSGQEDFSDIVRPDGGYIRYRGNISLDNRCAVSCSCPSYRYTFAESNYRVNAHSGVKPEPYRNASTKSNAPKLNKTKAPGLCKHLMLLAVLLSRGGILDGLVKDRKEAALIKSLDANGAGKFGYGSEKELKDDINRIPDALDTLDSLDIIRSTIDIAKSGDDRSPWAEGNGQFYNNMLNDYKRKMESSNIKYDTVMNKMDAKRQSKNAVSMSLANYMRRLNKVEKRDKK